MKKTGAQIWIECLLAEGVDTIFGYPGGAVINLYDELFRFRKMRHILTRHEQAAVHASDGYARATGKVGVCLVTSGPGATNTVTGINTAYMDSIPIVIFTGQVPTMLIGNDAFQEADIVGITRPCTKHNYLVKDVKNLARIIKEAFYIARSGRQGPVLVDIPKDVQTDSTTFAYPQEVKLRGYKPTYEGHANQINRALKLITSARSPLIYAGGGVILSGASQELIAFAEALKIPVATTLMGLGGFPGTHSLFTGMLGMHGTYKANMTVTEADLIIAIGARFDDRVTGRIDKFAPKAQLIHIDIDPTSISKNVRVQIPIVGDVKSVLKKMLSRLPEFVEFRNDEDLCQWHAQVEKWGRDYPLTYMQDNNKIKPQYVVEKIYELTEGDAIISTEVGQNQMWTAQFYKFDKPRTLLTSGGLGTMGYGFPAAIGAQLAFPNKIVVDIAGDGSIQMNIQELATVVQYNLPVKIAILNNQFLGMVRQWQQIFFDRKYSSTCLRIAPDFVKLAEAYGIVGLRATKPEEVVPVIEKALKTPKPVVMDFLIHREENVYPMVPAGAGLDEMILV